MTVLETLSNLEQIAIEAAQDQIDIEQLENLDNGDEQKLNELVTLYRYCEDDIVVLCIDYDDKWEEVLQILWNKDADEIIFEAL